MIKSVYALLLLLFLSLLAKSQPSLLSGDMQELVIQYNGKEESFTVVKDAFNNSQWYYIPNTPRLNEVKINNRTTPEISLLRYQFADETVAGGIKDGGILQFSVSLSPEPAALLALKTELIAKLSDAAGGIAPNISLAPLPVKSATATIYSPTDNTIVSNAFGTGNFPIFASQKAPFVLYLTKQGADINDALMGGSTSSNTGIPVVIEFSFYGLTPPASLRVKANYRKIFKHYSEDKVLKTKASYYGLFGASSTMRWTNIKEKLQVNGALTVEKIGSQEISEENMDIVMQGVMKRINDNIFQMMSPPPAIPPATSGTPKVSGRFASAGYNASFKKVELISELDEEFTWTERKIVERKTIAGGFIGVGQYPDDIKKTIAQFVPGFNWQTAHFILPEPGNQPELSQVTIKTELLKNGVSVASRTALWSPAASWKSIPGNRPVSNLDFAIAPYLNSGSTPSDLKFKTTTTLLQAGKQLVLESVQDLVNGGIPVTPPEVGITPVIFDPSDLLFKNIIPSEKLIRVQVQMKIGNLEYSKTIQPKFTEGNYSQPQPVSWLVKKSAIESNPVSVTLKYEYAGNTPSKTITMEDLKLTEPALNYLLRDPAKQ